MGYQGRVIFGVVALILSLGASAHASTEVGKLAVVNGDVKIVKKPEGDAGRSAKPNDSLYNDDIVKTGPGGTAKMLFTDQSVMDIGPASALKVSDYALKEGENRTGTFNLFYGKLRSLVTKKVGPAGNVQVKSGNAVMGVRGTEFMVDAPKPHPGGFAMPMTLTVASGNVAFMPSPGAPPVMVATNQVLTANTSSPGRGDGVGGGRGSGKGNDAPVVKQVSSEQVQSTLGSAKAVDNTFVAAVTIGSGSSSSNNTGATILGSIVKDIPQPDNNPAPPPPAPPPPPLPPGPGPLPGNQVHLRVTVQ